MTARMFGIDHRANVAYWRTKRTIQRGPRLSAIRQSGQRSILARDVLSAFDPQRKSAVHCGNAFDAGFSPYESSCLSR